MPGAPQPKIMLAPPPPWHRTRVARRLLWALCALIGVGIAAAMLPLVLEVSNRHYARRRAMTYLAPAGQVVYSDDPDEAQRLLSRPGYERVHYWDQPAAAGKPLAAGFRPGPVGQIWRGTQIPGAFSHGRSAAGGREHLVVVGFTLEGWPGGEDRLLKLRASTDFHGGTVADEPTVDSVWLRLSPSQKLRLLAGQPDAADPSHFTIEYELDGRRGVIDGWLKGPPVSAPRGDGPEAHPVLTIRDGPLATGDPHFYGAGPRTGEE